MAWTPSPHATLVEVIHDPADAGPSSVLVDHFNDPYEVALQDTSDESLRSAAQDYLRELLAQLPQVDPQGRVAFLDHWRPAMVGKETKTESYFGWLPFDPAPKGFIGPRGSFRFESASDRIAVLFASDRLDPLHYMGSGFGVAVAMHIRDVQGKPVACFVGATAVLPYGNYQQYPLSPEAHDRFASEFTPDRLYGDKDAMGAMAAAANLDGMVVRGVRIAASGKQWWIERDAVGMRRGVPHRVTMVSTGDATAQEHALVRVEPLVAHAARVFESDPSSACERPVRPTRDEKRNPPMHPVGLDEFRAVANIPSSLQHVAGGVRVTVMPCPRHVLSDRSLPVGAPRPVGPVPAGGPPIRSDDASAVQAFFHTRELVQRLQAYGWPKPADYFRLAAPEIKVFYRSGIAQGPGKDGRTVNACVSPEGWHPGAAGLAPGAMPPPTLEVHLAWADLRRRERAIWPWGGPPVQAIPFGIAADRRWLWHEFGHVLLVASTGELELRFAHNGGDAMAAIVADPGSKLEGHLRGSTFPFVHLPRRHDRCASDGWSWSGTMHAELAAVPHAKHPIRKGYRSEQILSSSLFRLYRCIGGDTGAGGSSERHRASHYAMYLILQAMQLMGDARIQPTYTAAQFVHWLRQADRQTGVWSMTGGSPFTRVGGTLAKVIRWAFEAQGLHGRGNGPGLPPPVDIYIRDRRPTTDVPGFGRADYGFGSYVPVSLHWQSQPSDPAPRWQADPGTGIVHQPGSGRVEVRVCNRGSVGANNVTVSLWAKAWPFPGGQPVWDGKNSWTECPAVGPAVQNVAASGPNGAVVFTFELPALAQGPYLLFAQATCRDDRANTDPALSLACSYLSTPLVDLVPHDNNLALRVIDVP